MSQPNLNVERIQPQSLEAESAVLGAMILEKEAIAKAIEILEENSFYSNIHRKIFASISTLYDKGEEVDLITLSEELKKRNQLDEVGGPVYLSRLLDNVPTAAHIEYHAKIVLEKAMIRRLINAATQVVTMSYDGTEDVETLLDKAEQLIFSISEKRLRQGFIPIGKLLKHTFEVVEELADRKKHITGVPSGLVDLDLLTTGFQPSDFVVVAGRPSMGKTSFALTMALNAAIDYKIPIAIFSLEMSKEQLVQRMLCSEARVDAHRVRKGFLSKSDWPKLTTAAGNLSAAPVYIDDSATLSVLEMRAKARRLKTETDIGLIIVDYLQLMQTERSAESRQQEISIISRSLKALAKELSVPVLALSQLSRAVESRGGDRRPLLSDLRESGAIEQDADLVLFIYREELYKPTPENHGKAEIIIGKQRNGPTGIVETAFIREYTRFDNLEKLHVPGEKLEPAEFE